MFRKLPMLIEKPREYTVRFEFLDRDDNSYGAIGARDVGFMYGVEGNAKKQPDRRLLFEGLNFGIHGDSRIAIVGRSAYHGCCLHSLVVN